MDNPLKIYSGSNALIYTTPINTGCRRKVQLMTEDSITVKFSDKAKMRFPVGTRIGDFYITKEQQEKYNAATGGYDYELKFDAYYWLWANKLLFYVMPGVTNAPKETSFKLTATIDVHAAVIRRCLDALGFKYDNSPFRVEPDEGFSTEAKFISYANMSVLGGIQAIAEAYECEWWIVGNAIHFGRCNASGDYDFTVGDNVASITSDSKENAPNRLIVFGSDRNLPPNYRTPASSDVVDAVVVKRLMLPEGTPWLPPADDIPENEIVEKEVVLEDVYPRTALTVSDVIPYEAESNDGKKQTFYRIRYGNEFPFLKEYILPDEELHIVFESGDLNGMDFTVKFNPLGLAEKKGDGSINPDAQMFEIVANEDYGRSLPDAVLHPAKTDKFSLYGWDSTKMEALGLLAAAEQELLTEGNKLLAEYIKDTHTYTCPMMWDWCKAQAADKQKGMPKLGSPVTLHFTAGDTGRKSRIIGYEHDLDIEYSNVTYICGEKVSVSRLKTLESKIEGLTHTGEQVKMQNSLDFLSKRYSDRTPYALGVGGLLTAENGVQGAGYESGMGGRSWGVDPAGNMSVESINVRSFMRVMELIVNRQRIEDADSMLTEGDTIESVEELTGAAGTLRSFKLRLREEWEGYRTAQVVNNVLRGVYNDLTGSLTGNGEKPLNGVRYATSWMKVTKVEAARNEITVTLYADADCPAGVNFAPVAGMKVARWGNSGTSETDRPRQRLIYLSSTEGRIVMRDQVKKPKTDEGNMEICLGTVPEFLVNAETGVGEGDYALYVKTLIAERIVKRPHGGLPEPELRYRGPYDPSARYYDGTELREETGDYERSVVSWMNCRWACDTKSVTDSEGNVTSNTAPSPVGTAWTLMEELPVYTENLIVNSNFARGSEGWLSWGLTPMPSGELREFVEEDGRTWVHVRSDAGKWLGWQTDLFPVRAGQPYTVSALARKLGGAGRLAMYLWWYDADKVSLGSGDIVFRGFGFPGEVAGRVSDSCKAPAGAVFARLMVGDSNETMPNEIMFTEVKLEEGANAATVWTPNAADLKGEDGKGISGVTNEYAVSASGTAAPTTGWQTAVPQTTATNRYLWNRETIVYTDTTSETTQPRVIGMYSEDGRGIASVTEHYLATAQASGVTKATAGWTEAVQAVTATKKYLWNYETIAYTKGAPTETSPVIIGTYGDKGDPGADGADYAPNLLAGTLLMDGVGYGTDYPGTNTRISGVTDGVRAFRQVCTEAGRMGSWMFLTALVDGGTVEDVFAAGREVTVSLECRSTAPFRMYLSTRSTAGGTNHGAVPNTVFAADASWHRVQATGVCTTEAGDDRLLLGINLADNCPAGSWLDFRKICVSAGRQGQWVPAASEMEGGRGVESIAKWWMSNASGTPPANPGEQYGQWESEASATDFGEDEPYLWSVTVTRYTDGEERVGNPVLEARWSKDGKDAHQYLLRVTPASVYVRADGTMDTTETTVTVTATVDGEKVQAVDDDKRGSGYTGYAITRRGMKLGTGEDEYVPSHITLRALSQLYSSVIYRLIHTDASGKDTMLAEAVLAFNRQGAQGHAGAYVPPPRPYSDYADGYVFLDGKTDVTVGGVTHLGRERVDVVLVWDSAGNHYVPWTCVKSHALDRNLTPSSSGWGTYWESDGGTWTQIATQVLLAQNAYIDLLSSRGIRVYDSGGNIVGALSSAQDTKVAGDIFLPFWLGGVMNQDGTFATNPNFGVGADGTIYCGGFNTGRRIRISGADKRMQVFDNSGREVVTIEGTAHPVGEGTEGLVESFKAKSDLGTLELSNSTASAKSTTVELGTVTIPAGGGRYDVAMEAVLQAQTYTYVSGWRDPAIDGKPATAIKAQAASAARVELGIYQDGVKKASASAQLAGTTVGASELAGVPTGSETYGSSQRVSVSAQLAAGTYTVRAVYTLTGATGQHVASQGATAVTVTAKAGATKRPVAYHSFTPTGEGERSELGSDGLVVRRSPVHFMRAGRVTDIGFVAEAQSEGFGMRVTPHGLQTRTGGNPWQSAPVTLCAGKINMHYATWEVYGADCCVSASGKAPQLAHTTDGDLEIMDIPGLAAGPENMFDPRNLVVQVTLAEPETESVHPMTVSARYDAQRGGVLITCRDTGWGKTSWTNIWVEVRLFPYAVRN